MLVNKKYSDGDIVSFKLVNGDEIVAKVVEQTDAGFKVSSPCNVVPSPQGLGLIQSLFSAKEDIDVFLRNDHILFHAESLSQMQSHYLKTTTGLDIQAKPGIII